LQTTWIYNGKTGDQHKNLPVLASFINSLQVDSCEQDNCQVVT